MFIYWIINEIYNNWGMFLYGSIQSYPLLIFLFLCSLIYFVCILIFFKSRDKNKAIFFTIYISLFYLVILIPFNRGAKVEDLKEYGFHIVDKIYLYEKEVGYFPNTLEDLYPNYLDENKKEDILENYVYWPSSYQKEVFTLMIVPRFLSPGHFAYIQGINEFVFFGD